MSLAMLVSGIIFAQESTNQLDANGKRQGVWKKYYQNGRVRYTGAFKHGKEVGTFKYYSAASSDHPIAVKIFNPDNTIADVTFYTEEGILQSKGKMDGKNRVGKWLYFHEDGKTVMAEENYVDGKLDGDYKTFYLSGKPTEIAYYKDGLLDSTYRKYSIKGHLYQHLTYKNGKLNGKAVYYNRKTGILTTKGQFKDDVRVGTWENYAEDGELISTEQPNAKKERPNKKS
ncbi:MAG: toxin-antitoxin system YwqK family antitoxin [Flavobacteriaceae bacterium]|nr:toxin-antitoxin system YwqK family antitoxin [Flavobacteriaceae bacterium]MCB0474227.1 toxin-antitoxin system YwqK family antitoxin [Flavobacteriaceae bacterium]